MKLKILLEQVQRFYVLSGSALRGIFRRSLRLRDVIEQMDYAGAGSFFIVFLVSLFIGMALSLQIATELAPLGLKMYTAKIVGISIIREIGPVAVALSYAGRVGSGMASELGSMVLTHQVDMLRVYGVDPITRLVSPRVLSSTVMLPVLTVIGDAVSLLGGFFITVFVSRQSGAFYWSQIVHELNFENILSGLAKPVIFGFLIACISCTVGLSARGGARGMRRSATSAVVLSTIMIIIVDFLLTQALFALLGMPV
jgi:phospholipid/cholesterol/gamma-HCH transport system permease protein